MITPLFEHQPIREHGGRYYLTPHPSTALKDVAAFMREAQAHGEFWNVDQDFLPDVVLTMRTNAIPEFLRAQGE